MGKANFSFAGVCAVGLTFAMVTLAWAYDLPIRDPDGVVVPTYVRLPIIILLAWLIDVLPRALVRRRDVSGPWLSGLWRSLGQVIRERWDRAHVFFAISGLATWYVCYATFRNLKSYVPFVHERIYDRALAGIDRTLFLGHDPAAALHSLLGTGIAASVLSVIYIIWIVLIPVSLAISLMWTRAPAAGSWFVTSIAVSWMLGVMTYFLVPTMGPIYSNPSAFANLKHTYVTTMEAGLLRDRQDVLANPHSTEAVQTIAAFPSLHVGLMVAVCLFLVSIKADRRIRWCAWVFLGLTAISTVYLGWHFFTDVLGGIVIGTASWWLAALGTGNHVRGRPRLVDRGSHGHLDEETRPTHHTATGAVADRA